MKLPPDNRPASGAPVCPFYVVGGTLPPESASYVERPADQKLYELCRRGEYCQVLSSRQTGKSSLMARTVHRLEAEGVAAAVVDLSQLGRTDDAPSWYRGLARILVRALALELDLEAWWRSRSELPAALRLGEFFDHILRARPDSNTVIFFDEIDATLELPFTDDFFAAIRACHNARATDPGLGRLSFVLLGVASAAELIKDPSRTPYNIGQPIELEDFSFAEAWLLLAGLALPAEQAEEVLNLVLEWTGGQPYLTQKLLAEIARRRVELPTTGLTAWVEQRVEETFLALEKRRHESNLNEIPRRLRGDPPALRRAQLKLYREVLRKEGRLEQPASSLPFVRLKLTGLISVSPEGGLHSRNRIYRRAFGERWIEAEMPPKEGRGTRLLALSALCAVLVLLLLAYDFWHLTKDSNVPPLGSYQRLSKWPMMTGLATELYARWWGDHALEAQKRGDLAEALLFNLRALKIEERETRREAIDSLGQKLAPLQEVWHTGPGERVLALGDQGDWYVTRSQGGGVEIHRQNGVEALAELAEVTAIRAVGRLLFTGDRAGRIAVYEVKADEVRRLQLSAPAMNAEAIDQVAVSHDLNRVVSVGGGQAQIWGWDPGAREADGIWRIGSFPVEESVASLAAARTLEGLVVATAARGSSEVVLRGLSRDRDRESWSRPLRHQARVSRVIFDHFGQRLFVAAGTGLALWTFDAPEKKDRRILKEGSSEVTALAISRSRLTSARENGEVTVWELAPEEVTEVGGFQLRRRAIETMTLGSAEERLATATVDGEIAIWSLLPPRPSWQKLTGGYEISSLALGPELRWLAVGRVEGPLERVEGQLELWSLEQRQQQQSLTRGAMTTSVVFDLEGRQLAAGDTAGSVRTWPLHDVQRRPQEYRHQKSVTAVALRPGSDQLFVGTVDGALTVWGQDPTTPAFQRTEHGNSVADLAFDSRGRWLLSEDQDSVLQLWDLNSFHQGMPQNSLLSQGGGKVTVHAFGPESRWLAIGRDDGRLEVWSLTPGESPIQKDFEELNSLVTAVSWGPAADRLIAATLDGDIHHLPWADGFQATPLRDGLALSDWPESEDSVRALAFRSDGRALALFKERRIFVFTAAQDPEVPWLRSSLSYGGWSGEFHFGKDAIAVISGIADQQVILETLPLRERAVAADKLMVNWEARLGRRVSEDQALAEPLRR